MSKVVVLGGCGVVGGSAVATLVKHPQFSEVVIGDFNIEKANRMVKELSSPKLSAVAFDAKDVSSVRKAIKGADVVLNCVGPFYNTIKPILTAALEEKINYIDVCDDVDVTLEVLGWDQKAKDAGITVLLGMGNSPGIPNVIAKLCATSLLDELTSVEIFHAHGGEPTEGEGVIGHRFHCMSIDIPMYLDGELKYVKYFGEDGIALRQRFTFPILGEVPVYPYPHPEQVTLPRYLKLRQVTNKGSVVPNSYYDMTRDLCYYGMASREPVDVKGQKVVPYEFAMAFLIKRRDEILAAEKFGTQRGCTSTVVKGIRKGKYREYRFHLASKSQGLGEGTGIPAAMGAILLQKGGVSGTGVMPPEACVDPNEFLGLIPEVLALDVKKEGGNSFGGLIVEQVDEQGNVTKIDL